MTERLKGFRSPPFLLRPPQLQTLRSPPVHGDEPKPADQRATPAAPMRQPTVIALLLLWRMGGGELTDYRERTNYIQYPLNFPGIYASISLGDPQQLFALKLDTTLSDIVVVDLDCGRFRYGCPKYCRDRLFAKIHCHPLCSRIDPKTQQLICDGENNVRYDYRNSSQSSPVGDYRRREWKAQILKSRKMFGIRWKDRLDFNVQDMKLRIWKLAGTTDIEFVRAEGFDGRLFRRNGNGVLGLAPGPGNLIQQLHALHTITYPIMSISKEPAFGNRLKSDHVLTFGAFNKARCVDWHFYKTVDPNGWMLEFQGVELNGVLIEETQNLVFTYRDTYLFAPPPLIEVYLEQSLIGPHKPDYDPIAFPYNCFRPLRLKFLNPAFNLTIGSSALFRRHLEGRTCESWLAEGDNAAYIDDMKWTIGTALLSEYCVAFDYMSNQIGLAKWRDPIYRTLREMPIELD